MSGNKGIWTKYKGTRFRSRLEAKWAAFFDLAGWRWEYEPVDLDGWIPDFALIGKEEPVYVEVKPYVWAGDIDRMLFDPQVEKEISKVYVYMGGQTEYRGDDEFEFHCKAPECLLLGVGLPRYDEAFMSRPFGVLLNESHTGTADRAMLWAGEKTALDFSADSGSYAYRISGEYDGDHHLRNLDPSDLPDQMWAEACNRTQWKGRGWQRLA